MGKVLSRSTAWGWPVTTPSSDSVVGRPRPRGPGGLNQPLAGATRSPPAEDLGRLRPVRSARPVGNTRNAAGSLLAIPPWPCASSKGPFSTLLTIRMGTSDFLRDRGRQTLQPHLVRGRRVGHALRLCELIRKTMRKTTRSDGRSSISLFFRAIRPLYSVRPDAFIRSSMNSAAGVNPRSRHFFTSAHALS